VFSLCVPNCVSYDPAFAYELAVIIEDGIRRMYKEQESIFYYLTVMNEQYEMPAMPEGSRDGILKGMYSCAPPTTQGEAEGAAARQRRDPQRGAAAQKLLEKYDVAADVWSVTSYQELYRDGHACDRWNMLHPAESRRSRT
jgi:pyruvate dehydrogenase E1 component